MRALGRRIRALGVPYFAAGSHAEHLSGRYLTLKERVEVLAGWCEGGAS